MHPLKYPVPRIADMIEHEWAAELAAHFGLSLEEVGMHSSIMATHLPRGTVRVELMVDSCVEFKYAFAMVSQEKKAIAVFTEHCGHHVFPSHGARVFLEGDITYGE